MNRDLPPGSPVMPKRSGPPIVETLLIRPRITTLMEQGLRNGFISIVAPPGYGKTYETTLFLKNANVRHVWLRMTRTDNLPSHFWQNMITEVEEGIPEVADQLKRLGFPDTMHRLTTFLHIIAQELYSGGQCVTVVDDFDVIENNELLKFFESLVETALENYSIIFISRKKHDIEITGRHAGGGVFHLGGDDLRFTPEEMHQFFIQKSIHLPAAVEKEIYAANEGWPLAVQLLSLQLEANPESYKQAIGGGFAQVTRLFETECFLNYPENYKALLIKLSLLSSFSPETVSRIHKGEPSEAIQMLDNNLFAFFDYNKKLYIFQNMYCEFLAGKQHLIPEGEKERVFEIAGDNAFKENELLKAVEYYSQAGMYEKMLDAMVHFMGGKMVLSQVHANYFLEELDTLPDAFAQENYIAQYVRAALYIQGLRTDEATAILEKMEERLLAEDTPMARAMLGEVYERRAGILMMLSQERFTEYYKKASEYLPHGSAFKHKEMLRFKNYSLISLQDYEPGALGRMEKAVCDNIGYMIQVENGAFTGFDYMFMAEAAYLTYDFERAETMAHRAIFEAKKGNQHDLVCNAYYILALTACMKGNYREIASSINKIQEYVQEIQVSEMEEEAAYADNWFHFHMGDIDRVAPWLSTIESMNASMTPMVIGREELLLAEYLLHKEKYNELIALLERVKDWYMSKGWGSRVNANVMLAAGYFRQGDLGRSLEVFTEAYEITYHNGIITPFVEAGNEMRTLVGHFRRTGAGVFDPLWLDNIYAKSSAHAKRISLLSKEYAKEHGLLPVKKQRLTKKEVAVIYNLSQGFTREELAEMNGVTVNTIKSTITNIYNKLGAVNRADAVRLAASQGYFEQK